MRDFHNANRMANLVDATQQFDAYEHGGRGMLAVIDATQEDIGSPVDTQDKDDIDAIFIMTPTGDLVHVGLGSIQCEVASGRMLKEEPIVKYGGRIWSILWLEVPTYLDEEDLATLKTGAAIRAMDDSWRRLLLSSRPDATPTDGDAGALQVQLVGGLQWLAKRKTAKDKAVLQGLQVKRMPLEAKDIQATAIISRSATQRTEIARQTRTRKPTGLDKFNRTKCKVELVAGLSKTARAHLFLFASEGEMVNLDKYMIEETLRRVDGKEMPRHMAVIATLANNAGGIRIDDDGMKRFVSQVKHLLRKPRASKQQTKLIHETIKGILEVEFAVAIKTRVKKGKKRFTKTEYVRLVINTAEGEDGTVTEMALHPKIIEGMNKGRGFYLPNSVFAIDDRDGGFAFAFVTLLVRRWQTKNSGWEGLDKLLDSAGLLRSFQQREAKGKTEARAYLDALLVDHRHEIGIVVIEWDTRRVVYKTAPLGLRYAQHQQQAQPLALPPATAKDAPTAAQTSTA